MEQSEPRNDAGADPAVCRDGKGTHASSRSLGTGLSLGLFLILLLGPFLCVNLGVWEKDPQWYGTGDPQNYCEVRCGWPIIAWVQVVPEAPDRWDSDPVSHASYSGLAVDLIFVLLLVVHGVLFRRARLRISVPAAIAAILVAGVLVWAGVRASSIGPQRVTTLCDGIQASVGDPFWEISYGWPVVARREFPGATGGEHRPPEWLLPGLGTDLMAGCWLLLACGGIAGWICSRSARRPRFHLSTLLLAVGLICGWMTLADSLCVSRDKHAIETFGKAERSCTVDSYGWPVIMRTRISGDLHIEAPAWFMEGLAIDLIFFGAAVLASCLLWEAALRQAGNGKLAAPIAGARDPTHA